MTRPTRSAALGLLLLASLAGCGSGEATRGGEEDGITERLVALPDVDREEAETIAGCVADGLFDGERFTKDERNEVTRSTDGDVDEELRQRVEALFAECGFPDDR